MARTNVLELEPEQLQAKAKKAKEQIELVQETYPEDIKPTEVGQLALKMLMADASGVIELDAAAKLFWSNCTKKYTPDAPKVIEVSHKQSPQEYLEEANMIGDGLLIDAEEEAEVFGQQADERGKELEAYENNLAEDDDALHQRTTVAEQAHNS